MVAKARREKADSAAGRKGRDIQRSPCFVELLRSTVYKGVRVCGQAECRRGNYVGTLRIKYPPAKPNNKSGAQAARTGGNWLTFPIDSDKRDTMM